ncbi:hypothetical protein T492DRAFT_844529 [Pavlovales sp. CCMP2436]|nr:hypothetical protein T492DRAFT_844529 [Pavlovales sp. CCMP2436]
MRRKKLSAPQPPYSMESAIWSRIPESRVGNTPGPSQAPCCAECAPHCRWVGHLDHAAPPQHLVSCRRLRQHVHRQRHKLLVLLARSLILALGDRGDRFPHGCQLRLYPRALEQPGHWLLTRCELRQRPLALEPLHQRTLQLRQTLGREADLRTARLELSGEAGSALAQPLDLLLLQRKLATHLLCRKRIVARLLRGRVERKLHAESPLCSHHHGSRALAAGPAPESQRPVVGSLSVLAELPEQGCAARLTALLHRKVTLDQLACVTAPLRQCRADSGVQVQARNRTSARQCRSRSIDSVRSAGVLPSDEESRGARHSHKVPPTSAHLHGFSGAVARDEDAAGDHRPRRLVKQDAGQLILLCDGREPSDRREAHDVNDVFQKDRAAAALLIGHRDADVGRQ